MTQTTYTDNVKIDGSQDITQLDVEGHSTQDTPLQTWKNSAGDTLAKVEGDGRIVVGDASDVGTPDTLIEAHLSGSGSVVPQHKRGLHVSGELVDETETNITWSVHEVELSGSSTTTSQATALRAGVITDGADVDTAVGIEVQIDKESTGTITEAVGLDVTDINQATTNYAIRTGEGIVHFGDLMQLDILSADPATPATDTVRLYAKKDGSNGKIYLKDWNGNVYNLTLSGSGSTDWANPGHIGSNSPNQGTFSDLKINNTSSNPDLDINSSTGAQRRINFLSSNSHRMQIKVEGSETGSDAGSDLTMARFNDSGSYIGNSIVFYRASGNVQFSENIIIGGSSVGTSGEHVLGLKVGTIPTSSPSDTVQLFVKKFGADAELQVRDELGNVTTLSSHQSEMVDTSNRPTPYVHREYNPFSGKKVELDLFGALQTMQDMWNAANPNDVRQFIHVADLEVERLEDWDANERLKQQEREAERTAWQTRKDAHDAWLALPEEERIPRDMPTPPEGDLPEAYTPRTKPAWMQALA